MTMGAEIAASARARMTSDEWTGHGNIDGSCAFLSLHLITYILPVDQVASGRNTHPHNRS